MMLELVQSDTVPVAHQPTPARATPTGRAAAFYLLNTGVDVHHVDAPSRDRGLGFLVDVLQGAYGPSTAFSENRDLVARYAIADPNPLALYLQGMALCNENSHLAAQLTVADANQAAADVAFCTRRWDALTHITDTLIRERITAAREARPNME